jgi:hypothetical protein
MKAKEYRHKESQKKRLVGYQVEEDECIWMKAGVVNFRLCDNAFDCYNCPFDAGMQRAISPRDPTKIELKEPGWVDYLKKHYHGAERPCRHALTGRIDAPKICPMNYECYHCAFDQMMDEIDIGEIGEPPSYTLASGYKMAKGYYYHLGHCWVRFDQPYVTFGRGNLRTAVLSPVTGMVLTVNHRIQEHPGIPHEDPYHEGWLYVLEPDMPKKNLKGLYYGKESMQWIDQESQKLLNLIGPEYESLASTGAEPISDVFGNFPELGWDQLVKTFLRTGS